MTNSRILVVDPIHEFAEKTLAEIHELIVHIQPDHETLKRLVADVEVLIVRSGVEITEDIIGSARRLRLIARAGNGFDNIDLEAARRRSVAVFNVPGASAVAVAEHTFALIFALSREIAVADRQLRHNIWQKSQFRGRELHGEILGIVGCGTIGKEVARIANGIGMEVIACTSRSGAAKRNAYSQMRIGLTDIDNLLSRADIVSLHCPLNESTRGLVDTQVLHKMKPSALLINTARGGVVNEDDLFDALRRGEIAGAGTDVFEQEGTWSKLFELENVVVTPHIGAMSDAAQERIARALVANISKALSGEAIENRLV